MIAARNTDCGCTFCAKSRNGCAAPSSSESTGGDFAQLRRSVRARQFGRQLAVLDTFQIREDRLLDEPVRSALQTRRGIFQPGAQQIVDFDTKSSARHISFVWPRGIGR